MAREFAMDRKEQMRQLARLRALEFLERQKGGPGERLSDEEAMAIAVDAQRTVRRQLRRHKRGHGQKRK